MSDTWPQKTQKAILDRDERNVAESVMSHWNETNMPATILMLMNELSTSRAKIKNTILRLESEGLVAIRRKRDGRIIDLAPYGKGQRLDLLSRVCSLEDQMQKVRDLISTMAEQIGLVAPPQTTGKGEPPTNKTVETRKPLPWEM